MGRRGKGYGSEDHLRCLLDCDPSPLTQALAKKARLDPSQIKFLPFPKVKGKEREFQGIDFLPPKVLTAIEAAWRDFWPSTGRKQSWDAIGRAKASDVWFLVEAKANQPEFCSPGTGAGVKSRKQIERSLNKTKNSLGVHRHFSWIDSYYQYANRLATLAFLRDNKIDARLVFIYFVGDEFPDGTPCPDSERKWRRLIEARRLTLGLPTRHRLSPYEYDLFIQLPICADAE